MASVDDLRQELEALAADWRLVGARYRRFAAQLDHAHGFRQWLEEQEPDFWLAPEWRIPSGWALRWTLLLKLLAVLRERYHRLSNRERLLRRRVENLAGAPADDRLQRALQDAGAAAQDLKLLLMTFPRGLQLPPD